MLIACNFHYIRESFETPFPSIFGVTPKQFEHQLDLLAHHGEFIGAEDITTAIIKQSPLKSNYICITFDDGLKEQFAIAKPILEKKGIPFIFFINPSNQCEEVVSTVHQIHLLRSMLNPQDLFKEINQFRPDLLLTVLEKDLARVHYNFDISEAAELKYLLNFKLDSFSQIEVIGGLFRRFFNERSESQNLYMNRQELRTVPDLGCLGSHTYHHYPLGQLPSEQIAQEIAQSQIAIEELVGKKVSGVSYPYGSPAACAYPTAHFANINQFLFGFTMERAANPSEIFHQPLGLSRFDCNDLPGGKYNLFGNQSIFAQAPKRQWNIYA
jgi:peptidoglycan/xylan/chitin deacetylase (PgdA/CDA1 family)